MQRRTVFPPESKKDYKVLGFYSEFINGVGAESQWLFSDSVKDGVDLSLPK